jgi:hypothetical protein
MQSRMRTTLVAGAAVAVALSGSAVIATGTATAAPGTPTITVHMTKHTVRLSRTSVHAGTVRFRVISNDKRFHQMQVARLHGHYTLQDAERDFGKAFSGNVKAVRRLDHHVAFRGGAPAHRSGYPGQVYMNLTAGHYYVFDQDGQGLASLNVHGTQGTQPRVKHNGEITANSYGFQVSHLPSSGWLKVRNISDQPHFIAMTRVKNSTTRRQVAREAHHPSNRQPPWLLNAGTDSSVISPYRHEVLHYRLPAGKYLVACFWPDDDTGMPHFYMGMWRLVHLG